MRRDQAQLADLGLERVGALDRIDPIGQPHHLAHSAAGLAGQEVLPHPRSQVAARPDIERMTLGVAEDVDAGAGRQRVGQMALAALCIGDLRGERAQLGERMHADRSDPGDQRVQHVDGGPGVGEGAVDRLGLGVEVPRERRQLAVGHLVARQRPASQDRGVDDGEAGPRLLVRRARDPQEADIERRVVGDQHAALGELEERTDHGADRRRAC